MEASPETWAELPWVTSPAPSRGHACCPTGLTEVCPAWVLPEGRALAGGGWLGARWAQGLTGVPGKMALFGTPSTGRCAALILPTWWTDVALLAGPNSSWQQLAAACGQGLPLILGGCGSPTRAEREPHAWPAVPQALLQAAWEGRRPAPIPQLLWPERPHLSWGCRACAGSPCAARSPRPRGLALGAWGQQTDTVSKPGFLTISCVALEKPLRLSEPCFAHV